MQSVEIADLKNSESRSNIIRIYLLLTSTEVRISQKIWYEAVQKQDHTYYVVYSISF